MNYYDNAEEVHKAAEILCDNGQYRISVYNSCLAMELYLKSRLNFEGVNEKLEFSHDTVNIYRLIAMRFPPKKDLLKTVTFGRKYFNESRYPRGDVEVYTKEFADEFLIYVSAIKSYIDNECLVNLGDLQDKYKKQ